MQNKICRECGTENEKDYIYCKNCGAVLPPEKSEPPVNTETVREEFLNSEKTDNVSYSSTADSAYSGTDTADYSNYQNSGNGVYGGTAYGSGSDRYNPAAGMYGNFNLNGVSVDDAAFFIGKKAYSICPKFMKMEMTGSKVSWCWPAAILGYFFGPLGSALWFFYRKMYKNAFILVALGLITTVITSVMTGFTDPALYDSIKDSLFGFNTEAVLEAIRTADKSSIILLFASSAIKNTVSILSFVLTGIFGYYAYKEHCVKTIRNFYHSIYDKRYYRMGLASLGGVSGGMLTLGIFIIIGSVYLENIINFIFTIF